MSAPRQRSLAYRLVRHGLTGEAILIVLLFVPAGSLRFWQGWMYTGLSIVASLGSFIYFYRHEPQLLERRLLKREKIGEQKRIMRLWRILGAMTLALCGADHRFGWSRSFIRPVPLWLVALAFLLLVAGNVLLFQVLKTNRFAASIVQTEPGQAVATTGPYRFVRHPMYAGIAVLWLSTPLALGSFVALPVSALLLPMIMLRLLNEEKVLRAELPAYADYCRRTPYRLAPLVW